MFNDNISPSLRNTVDSQYNDNLRHLKDIVKSK